jgi:hypothetical protein
MRNDQLLPAGRCPVVTFRLPVVSYLVSTPIWLYRLGRAANWACGSVANADVPLAYEFACAFAFRGHICTSSAYEIGIARIELMLAESAGKRVAAGNRKGSAPRLLFLRNSFLILLASIREQRAGPGIGLGAARNTSLYLRQLSSFAYLIACCRFLIVISLRQSSQPDNGSEVALRDVTDVTANAVQPSGRALVCRMERNPTSAAEMPFMLNEQSTWFKIRNRRYS